MESQDNVKVNQRRFLQKQARSEETVNVGSMPRSKDVTLKHYVEQRTKESDPPAPPLRAISVRALGSMKPCVGSV